MSLPARPAHLYRHRAGALYSPDVGFAAEILAVPRPDAPHGHDFIELAVVLAGRAKHVSRDGALRVQRGDAVLVRPWDWHGWEQPRGLEVANVYIDRELIRRAVSTISSEPSLRLLTLPVTGAWSATPGMAHLDSDVLEQVERAVAAIASSGRDVAPGFSLASLGQLMVVLGSVVSALVPQSQLGFVHPAVWSAVRILESRIAEPWTIAALAAAVGLSEGHLTRCFTRAFGTPPTALLANLRAERAAAYLIATDMRIAEIGSAVGWPDPNYFSRRFRALRGMPPRAFRRRVRSA